MDEKQNPTLSNMLWLGGVADSGKTTVASILAKRFGCGLDHYDWYDRPHHEKLAETSEGCRQKLAASLEKKWVHPEPQELFHRSLRSFYDRFPLIIEDLKGFPSEQAIIAEGFGFLPELLAPLLQSDKEAIWLLSAEAFKKASMDKRGKPSFRSLMSAPIKAMDNLLTRDQLLADFIRTQIEKENLRLLEIDGSRSAEQVADIVGEHFQLF